MDIAFIHHTADDLLSDWAFNSSHELRGDIFDRSEHRFRCYSIPNDSDTPGLYDENNKLVTPKDVARKSATWCILLGESAERSDALLDAIDEFLAGRLDNSSDNPAVVLIPFPAGLRNAGYLFRRLGRSKRIFWPGPPPQEESEDRPGVTRKSLNATLQTIGENQSPNPNVGFGLLIVNESGEFFLRQRNRLPGMGLVGTIGGSAQRSLGTIEALEDLARRRLTAISARRLTFGPLLSCSNLRDDFHHYIDLTFLALAKGNLEVTDDQLTMLNSRGAERQWFNYESVLSLWRDGRLFPPVHNAFSALLRHAAELEIKFGPRSNLLFSDDHGRSLAVPWGRSVLADLDERALPRGILPFFDGSIEEPE